MPDLAIAELHPHGPGPEVVEVSRVAETGRPELAPRDLTELFARDENGR